MAFFMASWGVSSLRSECPAVLYNKEIDFSASSKW